jgi:Lon protease-like protein
MADASEQWIALFPLNTVLFPEGVLPLRVFETRYIDMVRACMKSNTPFGVVAIQSGAEIGEVATPYSVGTIAHITEWDMPELGVLLIQTRGGDRFRILETRLLPSQRLEARIDFIPIEPVVDGGDNLKVCAEVLNVVIHDIERRAREDQEPQFIAPFSEPYELNNPAWVANRWCEILPIPLVEKQRLLEMQDVSMRLQTIEDFLHEHKVI